MDYKILSINNLSDKDRENTEKLIMDYNSNGEFINTLKYLAYHPEDRFIDDSIVVKDVSSGVIRSAVMAAARKSQRDTIISHPGTTFSGLIFNRKQSFAEKEEIIKLVVDYYESKYTRIELKVQPPHFSSQPNQEIEYLLLKSGFESDYTALSNLIDLSITNRIDNIYELYDTKRRNQIKKSIKESHYSFIQSEAIDEIIWSNMNENLQDKYDSSTTHSYEEIRRLQNQFSEHIVPYKTVREDGRYGAFALVYKFKNVFHTQYLDVNIELRYEYPNLFLLHNLIMLAIEEGYKYFSFGASTENSGRYLNTGLYNYKIGFGGGAILLPVYKKGIGK